MDEKLPDRNAPADSEARLMFLMSHGDRSRDLRMR